VPPAKVKTGGAAKQAAQINPGDRPQLVTPKNMPWKMGNPPFSQRLVEQAIAMPIKPYAAPGHGKKGEAYNSLAQLCNKTFKLTESDGKTVRPNNGICEKPLTGAKTQEQLESLISSFKDKYLGGNANLSGSDGVLSTQDILLKKICQEIEDMDEARVRQNRNTQT
jgi:hypothetical protein